MKTTGLKLKRRFSVRTVRTKMDLAVAKRGSLKPTIAMKVTKTVFYPKNRHLMLQTTSKSLRFTTCLKQI